MKVDKAALLRQLKGSRIYTLETERGTWVGDGFFLVLLTDEKLIHAVMAVDAEHASGPLTEKAIDALVHSKPLIGGVVTPWVYRPAGGLEVALIAPLPDVPMMTTDEGYHVFVQRALLDVAGLEVGDIVKRGEGVKDVVALFDDVAEPIFVAMPVEHRDGVERPRKAFDWTGVAL